MGSSSFFKGEKKKSKKDKDSKKSISASSAPIFTLPRLIEKKKKGE